MTTANDGRLGWAPLLTLACAAFVFNTSEFLPVGLLPDMAKSLGETESSMGLILTGYAWGVTLMSLPLTVATAKVERKKLLCGLILVFALCHFVVPWVTSFGTLFAARLGVAAAHSIFWAIMIPLAARMAPKGKSAVGIAFVMGGSILATIMGVPLGTHMGQILGWTTSFCAVGAAALAAMLAVLAFLPKAPAESAGSLASLPVILKRPALLQIYATVAVAILGYFTTYTYITPLLLENGWMKDDVVKVLMLFGAAGTIGTFLGGRYGDRFPSAALLIPLIVITIALLLIGPAAPHAATLFAVIVLWGGCGTALSMAFSNAILKVAPDAADVAGSMFSGIFNIGIGGGAFVGSLVSAAWGFSSVGYVGGLCMGLAALGTLLVFFKTGSAVIPQAGGARHKASLVEKDGTHVPLNGQN